MEFTREPIIETIITPKEGYKLVIKNSKNDAREEYFVDALEIVSFTHALFYRSLERPKAFLLPVSDYEVNEVRETRMVLKTPINDRAIKIGGGKEVSPKVSKEAEKVEETIEIKKEEVISADSEVEPRLDPRLEKKRDRRRQSRKRRGREGVKEDVVESSVSEEILEQNSQEASSEEVPVVVTPSMFSALLQPPPTLISETINRYRENDLFKGAFYLSEEEQYKPHDKVEEILNEEEEPASEVSKNEKEEAEVLENKSGEEFFEEKHADNPLDAIVVEDHPLVSLSLFEEEERGNEEEQEINSHFVHPEAFSEKEEEKNKESEEMHSQSQNMEITQEEEVKNPE